MESFTKEGRKLRPRKTAESSAHSEKVVYEHGHRPSGPHRSFGERPHRSFGDRPGGEHRPYGERRTDGEHRSFGERRPYAGRPDGERRSFGERRPYGDRQERGAYGEDRPRRSFGSRPDGERRPFGEHRTDGGHRSFGERRTSGDNRRPGNRPFGRRDSGAPKFNRQSDEGINRMISRRPLVSDREYSDNDTVPSLMPNEVRLNKFIANSGVCSRREADTFIEAGVVTVNGEVVTELGTKVNVLTDEVKFNGERLKGEKKVYLVMNKPVGYVTTASDPHAEKTVLELIRGCKERVYPVGRLDKNTTGVLMLTNDGEMAERLTHPSYDKKKIYQVALDRALDKEDYDKILSGITLSDGDVKADELEYIDEGDKRKLGIEIHSGKNRIVRRIFESLGYTVKALDRVYFAGLTKKGLKKGEWRYLTEGESNILKMGAYV